MKAALLILVVLLPGCTGEIHCNQPGENQTHIEHTCAPSSGRGACWNQVVKDPPCELEVKGGNDQ